jgi:hypothetical protein
MLVKAFGLYDRLSFALFSSFAVSFGALANLAMPTELRDR